MPEFFDYAPQPSEMEVFKSMGESPFVSHLANLRLEQQRRGRAKALGLAMGELHDEFMSRYPDDTSKWPPEARAEFRRQDQAILHSLATPEEIEDEGSDFWKMVNEEANVSAERGRVDEWPTMGVYRDPVWRDQFADGTDAAKEAKHGPDGMRPVTTPAPKPAPAPSPTPVSLPRRPPAKRPTRQDDSTRARIANERMGLLIGKAILGPLRKNADEMPSIDNRKPMNAVSKSIDLPEEAGWETR